MSHNAVLIGQGPNLGQEPRRRNIEFFARHPFPFLREEKGTKIPIALRSSISENNKAAFDIFFAFLDRLQTAPAQVEAREMFGGLPPSCFTHRKLWRAAAMACGGPGKRNSINNSEAVSGAGGARGTQLQLTWAKK